MDTDSLADILEAYVAATPNPADAKELAAWRQRYPNYAQELADFAANWAFLAHAPAQEPTAEEVSRWQERGRLSRAQLLTPPLTGLLAAGNQRGLSLPQLAQLTGLSVALVMLLEKRLVRFTSLPSAVIERVSAVLRYPAASVIAFLQQPPVLAPSAQFKTRGRPEPPRQQDWAEAVTADRSLTPAQKQELVRLPQP